MKTILQIAEEEGLLPEGELPKYPVERFIDYQELKESLERFAARIRADDREFVSDYIRQNLQLYAGEDIAGHVLQLANELRTDSPESDIDQATRTT